MSIASLHVCGNNFKLMTKLLKAVIVCPTNRLITTCVVCSPQSPSPPVPQSVSQSHSLTPSYRTCNNHQLKVNICLNYLEIEKTH